MPLINKWQDIGYMFSCLSRRTWKIGYSCWCGILGGKILCWCSIQIMNSQTKGPLWSSSTKSQANCDGRSISDLTSYLTTYKGLNFLKSHGKDTPRFIKKQGLDQTFYECENHLWRIGRRLLPTGIRVDGGSDWVCLYRDFAHYIVTEKDELLTGLKAFYKYTLLPAEVEFSLSHLLWVLLLRVEYEKLLCAWLNISSVFLFKLRIHKSLTSMCKHTLAKVSGWCSLFGWYQTT